MEPTFGHGWNQQFRDLPYKPFRPGLRCTEGASVGKGLEAGLASLLEALGCLGGYVSFSFRKHECKGLPVAWPLPGTRRTSSADGKPQGPM